MSDRLRSLLLIVMLLISGHAVAQERMGLLPSSVKWQQLVHDSLRIIYPVGQEQAAKRVASLMLKLAKADPIATHSRYKPISVVLQPETNISNGYVGLAPYVSEFYLESHENPFELGSIDWNDLLAIHEYRHVLQVNAANTGINHLAKVIFGETVFSGMYSLSIPNWYREGDAVYAETKWTKQGRGRISNFTLPFYQKLMEGEPWKYYKLRNGSYKEYIPDYYPFGYLIVQYGNHIFGEATWDSIVHQAPLYKHPLRPFSDLIKENYGDRVKGFYLDAMEWYGDQWAAKMDANVTYPEIALREKDVESAYFDMTFPNVDGNGDIYASITTFDYPTAIYKLGQDGHSHKIASAGFQKDTYFDFNGSRFIWTELRYNPRWVRKDKNVIVVYDTEKHTRKTIWPEKGYFTPSLNERGDKIVALHEGEAGDYALQIIDANTRKVITELPNESNLYLGYPCFTEDDKSIIATSRNKEGKMCLVEQNIASGKIRYITHYSFALLGRPVLHDNWIFLTTEMDDIEQVFAVDRNEGIFYQVSQGRYAHFDAAWDPVNDELISSEYRLDGKKLVRLPGKPSAWKLRNLNEGVKEVNGYTGRNLIAETTYTPKFKIKNYSPWSDAINPHSWVVTADDPYYGVEGRSDNILNTVSIAGGYEINRNTKAKGPYLNAIFGMWFPQFNLGISNDRREIKISETEEATAINNRFTAGISLPLLMTPGVYKQDVLISANYNTGFSKLKPRVEGYDDIKFNYGTYRMVLINGRKKAYRQYAPTFAQRLDVSYSREFSGTSIRQFFAASDLAFPAFRPSHSLILHGETLIQDISEGSIQLRSNYNGARGFAFSEGQTQWRVGATYGFPLLYPDIGIGNILYTRRIRLQPFADYGYTNFELAPSAHMVSVGAELIIDFDFPPLSLGVRYARLLSGYEGGANQFEFFIPSPRF